MRTWWNMYLSYVFCIYRCAFDYVYILYVNMTVDKESWATQRCSGCIWRNWLRRRATSPASLLLGTWRDHQTWPNVAFNLVIYGCGKALVPFGSLEVRVPGSPVPRRNRPISMRRSASWRSGTGLWKGAVGRVVEPNLLMEIEGGYGRKQRQRTSLQIFAAMLEFGLWWFGVLEKHTCFTCLWSKPPAQGFNRPVRLLLDPGECDNCFLWVSRCFEKILQDSRHPIILPLRSHSNPIIAIIASWLSHYKPIIIP